jgi:tetratricopeptide (TPR) repeat protein
VLRFTATAPKLNRKIIKVLLNKELKNCATKIRVVIMPLEQQLTIQQAVKLAMQYHSAGELPKAQSMYQQILNTDPNQPDALHLLGVIAHQGGKSDIAVELIRKAIAIKPDYAEAYCNLGNALKELDQLEETEKSYRRSIELNPHFAHAHSNLGVLLQETGRMKGAEQSCRRALELNPEFFDAQNNLSSILIETGRLEEAEQSCRRTLQLNPNFAHAHSNLGVVLLETGRLEEAERSCRRALELNPNCAAPLADLALVILRRGRSSEAVSHLHRALEIDPAFVKAQVILSKSLDALVPLWHVPMMNDTLRNEAYLAALRSAITADSKVFEIGTGSGLIAMMAARLGAKQVTTCEAVELIAGTAKEVVTANGLADSINVIAKQSTDVVVGVDITDRADILVSEILSSEFLGEAVLPSIEDAKSRLLKPGGRIIPGAGSIMISLFGGDGIGRNVRVDNACGFDLSKFNEITSNKLHILRYDLDIELLSDDVEAFNFDFNAQDYFPADQKVLRIPVRTAGRCFGLIQWNRMQMDEVVVFENHPSVRVAESGWSRVIYLFPDPINVEPGQIAVISATHDRQTPWFTLESLEKPQNS